MTRDRRLGMVLIVAVLVRVGVALYLGDVVDAPPLLTDQRSYHALSQRLLTGHGYSFDRYWYPFTPADTPTAHWSFLHPLFVAGIYALFGLHPLAVRLAQAVLGGLLLPWMVYRLAKQMFPDRSAVHLLAALLAAGYGYFVLYAATLMTETPYLILLVWCFEQSLRLSSQYEPGQAAQWRDMALLGLTLGLATLVRQSILPWVPLLFLWLLWQGSREGRAVQVLRGLMVTASVMAALIFPWTYRNVRVYGQFLLLNSNTGYAMYSAQHPIHGNTFSEFFAAPLPSDLRPGNEAQLDRDLMRRGLQFVRDDPMRYLRLCLSRTRAYFEFWPTPDTSLLHNIGRTASFGLLWPLILYGLVLSRRCSSAARWPSLILTFMVFYPLLHILTWAMVRYRLPVDAVAMPLAALAVERLCARGRAVLTTWRSTVARPQERRERRVTSVPKDLC